MITNRTLRVATRGSQLARIQTDWVISQLRRHYPDIAIEVVTIKTTGDAIIDRSLDRVGGKGLFTEELERAILNHCVDFAVHSLKDLPTELAPGLRLGAVPVREDARDALIGLGPAELRNSSRATRVGMCSLRRIAQLRRLFPGVEIATLRGNVDTRIRKVKEGVVHSAVLALAGLVRLGRQDVVSHVFSDDQMLPAPGQGALAVEIRSDDEDLANMLRAIHSPETEFCVVAERTFLQRLGGGCQVPVGAHATIEAGTLTLTGNVISPDGQELLKGIVSGPPAQAEKIAENLANDLIQQGATRIIEAVRHQEKEEHHG